MDKEWKINKKLNKFCSRTHKRIEKKNNGRKGRNFKICNFEAKAEHNPIKKIKSYI